MSKKKEEKPKLLCLECSKPIVNGKGGRLKMYCGSLCRGRFFAKKISAGKDAEARGGRAKELWDELQGVLSGKVPVSKQVQAFNKQLLLEKELGGRDNALINAARGRDASGINEDELRTPKKKPSPLTIQQIRELCPKNLKGLDRTEWINQEKKKHGL